MIRLILLNHQLSVKSSGVAKMANKIVILCETMKTGKRGTMFMKLKWYKLFLIQHPPSRIQKAREQLGRVIPKRRNQNTIN